MVFRLVFALNIKNGGYFEGGCHGGSKGAQPPCRLCNLKRQWPHPHYLVGRWDIFLAVKPNTASVAGSNMLLGWPSCGQKNENTTFEIVLQSIWGLLSPGKHVARSSTPCQERSHVWDTESEWVPKYMQLSHQCWKQEEFWKASSVL